MPPAKALKSGKSANIDSIRAEMLVADLGTSTEVRTDLFRNIWGKDMSKSKIPKKGNLRNCVNWQGTTLLSIPSKVLCKIFFCKIDAAIDARLRQGQTGVRRGRTESCRDHYKNA